MLLLGKKLSPEGIFLKLILQFMTQRLKKSICAIRSVRNFIFAIDSYFYFISTTD